MRFSVNAHTRGPVILPLSKAQISIFAGSLIVWLALVEDASAENRIETSQPPTKTALVFEKQIVPIFKARCFQCHGEKSKKGGLDLRRRFTMIKGGDSGSVLDLKNPEASLLLEMIEEGTMPPEGKPQLTEEERKLIQQWVAAGSPLAGKDEPQLADAGSVSHVTEEDRKFWAFKPPQKQTVPVVRQKNLVRTPIDAFLLAKLEQHGASFMPVADKRVLIRRLSYDLHGLPPTPTQVQEFLADHRPDAYERLIDRLLDSPRYGERWGRHWLDVAGYADSDGYLDADRVRPEAWRYRDYVIRSFNNDKPYNRFLLEQIAGDELTNWKLAEELTPEMADNLIATGFLRTAPDPTYPGYIEQPEVNQVIASTMEIFSSSLLGLTVQCARCHEHKMDPISQREYYQLWAFFNPALDPQKWIVSPHRNLPLANEKRVERVTKQNQQADARIKQLQINISELTTRFREKTFQQDLKKIDDAALLKKVKAALVIEQKKRNAAQNDLVAKHAANVKVSEADLSKTYPEFQQKLTKFKAAIASETALKESIVQIRGLYDLEGKPQPTHLLRRGDYRTPGIAVQPKFPEVLTSAHLTVNAKPGYKTSGRRLALARWLVDPGNPLTARVHVNRIWSHHFGTGIVKTLDNFGKIGARPTHPELLDWLTMEFVENGWSHKQLHRLILKSSVYRQSSQSNPKLKNSDPQNQLLGYWPPRRIEGEAVRDAVLLMAGKLNFKMFGSPVPVSRNSQGLVTVATNPEGNRRSIYLIVRRSQAVTLLELFDTPTMETNCTNRTESIVVTQALTMLNSEFTARNGKALAERIMQQEPSDVPSRIEALLQLVYTRRGTEDEHRELTQFLNSIKKTVLSANSSTSKTKSQKQAELAAWTQLAVVLLNSNEFFYLQ